MTRGGGGRREGGGNLKTSRISGWWAGMLAFLDSIAMCNILPVRWPVLKIIFGSLSACDCMGVFLCWSAFPVVYDTCTGGEIKIKIKDF